jgi:hypothetical protein
MIKVFIVYLKNKSRFSFFFDDFILKNIFPKKTITHLQTIRSHYPKTSISYVFGLFLFKAKLIGSCYTHRKMLETSCFKSAFSQKNLKFSKKPIFNFSQKKNSWESRSIRDSEIYFSNLAILILNLENYESREYSKSRNF